MLPHQENSSAKFYPLLCLDSKWRTYLASSKCNDTSPHVSQGMLSLHLAGEGLRVILRQTTGTGCSQTGSEGKSEGPTTESAIFKAKDGGEPLAGAKKMSRPQTGHWAWRASPEYIQIVIFRERVVDTCVSIKSSPCFVFFSPQTP